MGTVYHQKLFLFLFFLDSFVQIHIFIVVIHFIWKSSSYDIVQWYSCKTVCNFKDNFSWFLKSFLFCVFFFFVLRIVYTVLQGTSFWLNLHSEFLAVPPCPSPSPASTSFLLSGLPSSLLSLADGLAHSSPSSHLRQRHSKLGISLWLYICLYVCFNFFTFHPHFCHYIYDRMILM